MKNALKGALWSGLVFPGLGQVVLKHPKRGVVIMLAVGSSMLLAVVTGVRQALAILEKAAMDEGFMSFSAILKAAIEASITSRSPGIDIALLLATLGWVVGTIDAYRLGREADLTRRPQPE